MIFISKKPLFLLQKKIICIITLSPPQTHTKPLFHKLNWPFRNCAGNWNKFQILTTQKVDTTS